MKALSFLLLFVSSLLLAQTPTLEKVTLQLQWKYQFQFAGFIMAKELGYYKKNGLDVTLLEIGDNTDTLSLLDSKKVDFALSNFNVAYQNKKLLKTTLVATYFQRSPLILVAQKEIQTIEALKHKKIEIALNDYHNSSITSLLYFFGIDKDNIQTIQPSYTIQNFIDKKVDATTAFTSNELYELQKQNISYTLFDPIDYGFVTSANNLFTTQEKIKNNPMQINAFLEATQKGWAYALYNIQKTAELIHNKYAKNQTLEKLIYEGKATRELMLLNLYEIGHINKEFVYQEYKRLVATKKITSDEKPQNLFLDDSELHSWLKQQYVVQAQRSTERLVVLFLLLLLFIILLWSYRMHIEIKRREIAEEDLKHLAHYDMLTDLPNRVLFLDRLNQAMKHAKRRNEKVALFFIDLDYFKNINDSYGHQVGDAFLQKTASVLQKNIRESDTVARIGGDEFVLIFTHFNDERIAHNKAENIMKSIQEPVHIMGHELQIKMSIGIALFHAQDNLDSDTLIKYADTAMYEAKESGRNSYVFHKEESS